MAASTYERDFMHLFTLALTLELSPRPVEPLINAARRMSDIAEQISDIIGPPPALVVIQGGENDVWDDSFSARYEAYLTTLTQGLSTNAQVIVLGDWYSAEKSDCGRAIAAARGWPWVNLFALQQDGNLSGDGGPYSHEGVASHPNDSGMKAIAGELLKAWKDARRA